MRCAAPVSPALALILLAACSAAPRAPAPHQIHIVGASAGFPFTSLIAERLMREDADAIAPLVRAGGSGDGIARFCDGPGALHPDLVLAARSMTAAETARCARDGVGRVASVPVGFTALVPVTAKAGPTATLTRATLARALTGVAVRWADLNPALPAAPIRLAGPAPDPMIADGLFGALLPPTARIRRDGAYRAHGANAELVAADVVAVPGTIGLLPYAQALAHADTLRMLALDGVPPTPATIAAGRYPTATPLLLIAKPDEIVATPALPRLLGYAADALAPGGAFERRGLLPLPPPARAASVTKLRILAQNSTKP